MEEDLSPRSKNEVEFTKREIRCMESLQRTLESFSGFDIKNFIDKETNTTSSQKFVSNVIERTVEAYLEMGSIISYAERKAQQKSKNSLENGKAPRIRSIIQIS